MQFNLPVVPITDLAVHKREQDLVAATQGRSFWIFDDLPLLHQIMATGKAAPVTRLFKPEFAYRMQGGGGGPLSATASVGKNPPNGVVVYYAIKARPSTDVVLEFLDATGKSIRKFTAAAKPSPSPGPASGEQPAAAEEGGPPGGGAPPARVPIDVGLNRFIWDMRYPDAARFRA